MEDIFSQVLVLISSGGIVAGLFELFRSRIAIRRQEYLEISRIKIDSLSKSVVYYAQMDSWLTYLTWELLKKEDKDTQLCFYYVCKTIHIFNKWETEIGQLQLDNISAEQIIFELRDAFYIMVLKKLGYPTLEAMTNMIDDKTSYESFRLLKPGNKELFDKFGSFISSLSPEETDKLCKVGGWFRSILWTEVYHTYRIWYNEDPYVDYILRDTELLKFLKNRYPVYYKRIMSFKKTKWGRERRYVNYAYEGLR